MLAEGPVGASLGNTRDGVHARLDRLIDHADIVKVSAEDLAWLEPDTGQDDDALDDAAERWAARGPALVVLTHGGDPLRVARPGQPLLRVVPPRVDVVDTVGAGDSLAAGLFAGLLAVGVTDRQALEGLADDDVLRVVEDAALVAALNCTRVGADPPTRGELEAARAAR
jgi:fructokinase